MRVADLIAYVNHDIDDAMRAGLLQAGGSAARSRSRSLGALVVGAHRHAGHGRRHRNAGRRADRDPHERRGARGGARAAQLPVRRGLREQRSRPPSSRRRRASSSGLWEKVRERPDEFLDRRTIETEGLDAAARDFIAGMTDRYAVRLFEQLFIPKPWAID